MGKVKITWDEDMKKEIHKACKEYFSTVPIERLENFFRIVLYDTYDTAPNVKDNHVKNKINGVKVNVNSYDKEPDNLTIDEVNLIKDVQYDIKGKNNIM